MEKLAREFCVEYINEGWRIGFAAGFAVALGIVVIVHLLMRIFNGTWENFEDKKKGESGNDKADV